MSSKLILYGAYRFGSILFELDNDDFGLKFASVYDLSETCETTPSGFFKLHRISEANYVLDSSLAGKTEGILPVLIGLMESELDTIIRSSKAIGEGCHAHASTAALGTSGIACVGLSGTGKTSLAIELAKLGSGSFVGDEYAHISFSDGVVSHERYPIHVKKDSHIRNAFDSNFISVESPFGIESAALSPDSLQLSQIDSPVPLRAIVFPHFSPESEDATFQMLSIESLLPRLMSSVVGCRSKRKTFVDILHCIARYRIAVIDLEYGDARMAAAMLSERLDCDESVSPS